MGFAVILNGMKELEGKLNNLSTALKVDVSDEINASALKIENQAKRLAPVNFGQLRNSIALTKDSELTYTVAANASYAAYVEFGTGQNYKNYEPKLPNEWRNIAADFWKSGKGKTRPQPYLFPAVKVVLKDFKKRFKDRLKALLKK
jgi:HK97 gp10 family phage protein